MNAAQGHIKGLVKEIGDNGRVRVLLPEYDGLVTDWLPVVQSLTLGARAWAVPRVDTQVIVLPGLGTEDAVVLGAIYSRPDPAPFEDPAVIGVEADDGVAITYDPGASRLMVQSPKAISIVADDITIVAKSTSIESEIDVKGNVRHQGDMEQAGDAKRSGTLDQSGAVTVTGAIAHSGALTTGSATIGGIPFATHKHPAGTPFTGAPVP
jgi:phage baseplate assembly protein V